MITLDKPERTSLAVLIWMVLFATPLTAQAENTNIVPLNTQVFHLAQQCLNGENLSAEQLQQTMTKIDALNATISQGDHPKKKLLLIRLKKSRNMCHYLAQLQQKEE